MSNVPHRLCSVEGCNSTNYEARGLCKKHYDYAKNTGQLNNLPKKTLEQRFWEKVNKNGPIHPVLQTPCWVWTAAPNPKGYGVISLGSEGKGNVLAHRLSWEIQHGDIPKSLCVLHKCDNPPCVNPEHLFLGTKLDNNRDMIAKGRFKPDPSCYVHGAQHGNSKLSDDVVREARVRFGKGKATIKELAKENAVSKATMHAALTRQTWRHVE